MADPEIWGLYFRLFGTPQDANAEEAYSHLDPGAREQFQNQYVTALESNPERLGHYQRLFHPDSRRHRKYKSYTPHRPAFRKDSYILAHQYQWFMDECDMRRCVGRAWRECANPYYENLLANQDEPLADATDDLSRAIRYAKEHYECFYDKSQVAMIIGILDKQSASMQPSLDGQKRARVDLHNTAHPSKQLKSTWGERSERIPEGAMTVLKGSRLRHIPE